MLVLSQSNPPTSSAAYCATRLPLAFFLGVSAMVRPISRYVSYRDLYWSRRPSALCLSQGVCRCRRRRRLRIERTGWKRLLQLLNLLAILQDQGVQVSLAADLELHDRGLLVSLDARGCFQSVPALHSFNTPSSPSTSSNLKFPIARRSRRHGENVHEASLRLAISMNCKPSQTLPLKASAKRSSAH